MQDEILKSVKKLEGKCGHITIGEAIRAVRKARNWQQKELATMVGISGSYLCDIEKNRTTPSVKTLTQLSKKLVEGVDNLEWQFFLQFNYVNNGNID